MVLAVQRMPNVTALLLLFFLKKGREICTELQTINPTSVTCWSLPGHLEKLTGIDKVNVAQESDV